MRHIFAIVVALFQVSGVTLAAEESFDPLALAGRLLSEGQYQQAEKVLAGVEESEKESATYATVRGLLHLYQDQFAESTPYFLKLKDAEDVDPYVFVYLGQAYFGLKKYPEVLASLQRSGHLAKSTAAVVLMEARSLWESGDKKAAFQSLQAGIERFAGDFRLVRVLLSWLKESKLTITIFELRLALQRQGRFPVEERLEIPRVLIEAGQYDLAAQLMELMALEDPSDVSILTQLGYAYLKRGDEYNAALQFEKASYLDESLSYEAAELYRGAGLVHLAPSLNQKVKDQKRKFKQRFALLIEISDYRGALLLEGDLIRLGILQEQELIYAMAYAFFQNGDLAKAATYLDQITKPDLYEKSLQLRREMIQCQADFRCV